MAPAARPAAADEPAEASKSETSRRLILDAAARLFRDQGYAATTLRQIADAANMKAGSIYYHFASKDEILQEVLDTGLRAVTTAVRDGVEALPVESPHRRRIETAIRLHLEALLRLGDYTSAYMRIYRQVPKEAQTRNRPLRRTYAAYWDRMFSEAQAAHEVRQDLSVESLRMFVFGALNWTVEWNVRKSVQIDEMARRIGAMVFDGIGVGDA